MALQKEIQARIEAAHDEHKQEWGFSTLEERLHSAHYREGLKMGVRIALESAGWVGIEERIRPFIKFLGKSAEDGDSDNEVVFQMDDLYNEVYQANRGKHSFRQASLMAYEAVIKVFFLPILPKT